jgi:hypothetical protein
MPAESARCGARNALVGDLVLHVDVTEAVTDDNGGFGEPDLLLGCEPVQRGHGLVRAIVVGEAHDDHVLRAEAVPAHGVPPSIVGF